MTVIQSIVLGFIQGLTEFLPVSSSGHLVFLPKIFGWADQGLGFDVVVHLGSLMAVLFYFRIRLWKILSSFFYKGGENIQDTRYKIQEDRNLGLMLLLSIIPASLVGLLFNNWIETNLRSAYVVAFGLIFWGIVLWVADEYSQKHQSTEALEHTTWKQSLFVGCAQAVALIPGTSRSGITMTAGLFSRFDKKSAAEFSFLMSVPIIFLAGAKHLVDMLEVGLGGLSVTVLIIGFLSAFVSGLLAIWGLMKVIQKYSFKPFVAYRVIVGVLILLFL